MLDNKKHWDNVGKGYSNNWTNYAKTKLSEKETNFILKYFLKINKGGRVLDIGPGNGRIINNYLEHHKDIDILGLDISESMIDVCQKKFKEHSNVTIKQCDLSKEDILDEENFDFISAIRILKYNDNWKDIVQKISKKLKENGFFVFTMINNNSLDRFSIYPIKVFKTNKKEITNLLSKNNLKIIEIVTFTKIPDVFYNIMGKNKILSKLLLIIEKFLEIIFGKLLFGRIFFIVCKK